MKNQTDIDKKKAPASVVVRSKLFKPEFADNLVVRHIVTLLATKVLNNIRAVLIVAPAGYGKSTLLGQTWDALRGDKVSCFWLGLDNKDNDPLRFLSHLCASVNEMDLIDKYIGAGSIVSERKTVIDYLITDIANAMETQPCRRAVFIDDYHFISNSEVHNILEQLISYSPQQTAFIIASRNEPDLALTPLKMRDEIYHVTTDDLAFALDETDQFLNQTKQLELDSKLVETLAARTEGWVAGLQLASLALGGSSDPEKFIDEFTGSDRDVTDYLGEVILDQQSDDIKRFLLWTSLLERMNADLVNAVLGIETGQNTLEQLEEDHLFTIPLDRTRTWYRYHHLFADFLKVRLDKNYPGMAGKIYRQASSWCVEQGYLDEAINYALADKDFDRALTLIADIAENLLLELGENWTLLHWVEQIPDNKLPEHPDILLSYIWSLIFSRQHATAREELDKLDRNYKEQEKHLSSDVKKHLSKGIKLNQCLLEAGSDNSERCIELTTQWLRSYPEAEPSELLTANVLLAYASVSTFDYEQGISAAKKAVFLGEQYSVDYLESWARIVAGLLKLDQADLTGAAQDFEKGLTVNNKQTSEFSFMGSLNAVLLAEVYYEQNKLSEAQQLLENRFDYIDNETVVEPAYAGYRILANLQLIQNDLDAALDIIRHGKESAIRAGLKRLVALLTRLEIHTLLAYSMSKEARHVAKQSGYDVSQPPSINQDSRRIFQEIGELVQAELYLDRRLYDKALSILNAHVLQAEETGRQRHLLDLLLLRARALHASKQIDDAQADISKALSIAAKGGFYRRMLDAGTDVHRLLRRAVKKSVDTHTNNTIEFLGNLHKLLSLENQTKPGAVDSDKTPEALLEPMTRRERQMLDMITTGQTNKDIAGKLFISEQTVKWHLHQLYQKLGVKNRTSAIAKATALSLI